MSHLKLVSSTTPPDSTAYSEALEQLDAGLCIIDGDGAVMANNQAFCRLLGLPSDWASPKAAKRTVPASEQLVTGWLARIASEGGSPKPWRCRIALRCALWARRCRRAAFR
ncbi:MAG: PAS domain-containing protein [Alphaproteobacteria bacterium]|jgi:PAS domain-containing protein